MRNYLVPSLFTAASLVLTSGCNHYCHRPECGGAGVFPPGATASPGATFIPPSPQTPAPPPAPVNPVPPAASGYGPMPSSAYDLSWRPADCSMPMVQLRAPEPVISARVGETPRLRPPQIDEKVTPAPRKPAVSENTSPPPALPVGIPQYAVVKDRVATGRRPFLDDGLDWLRENGFRTVLHLRRPGEDDTSDRKEVEKRGLKYLSLEVSPQTLTRKLVEEFTRIAKDTAGYPLFVYDRDGALAGGLWYLHFRLAEDLPDETARLRAGTLGLREDRDSHREMWLAIRQLLVPPANP
jgi:protein tyrosine phosphatase (PTP) superfamily phosphohydrolase (DUF442 family)